MSGPRGHTVEIVGGDPVSGSNNYVGVGDDKGLFVHDINISSPEILDTLQELLNRLSFLGGLNDITRNGLRTLLMTGSTTACTGTLTGVTTVTTLTNFGIGIPASLIANAQMNLMANQANIINAVGA